MIIMPLCTFFFFFNDTATTEIYTLSLHDALPISDQLLALYAQRKTTAGFRFSPDGNFQREFERSEEHTSELQSPCNLVCRLLLEKKKKQTSPVTTSTSQSTSVTYIIVQLIDDLCR